MRSAVERPGAPELATGRGLALERAQSLQLGGDPSIEDDAVLGCEKLFDAPICGRMAGRRRFVRSAHSQRAPGLHRT